LLPLLGYALDDDSDDVDNAKLNVARHSFSCSMRYPPPPRGPLHLKYPPHPHPEMQVSRHDNRMAGALASFFGACRLLSKFRPPTHHPIECSMINFFYFPTCCNSASSGAAA
jgi:hypothetical protein